MITRYSRAQQLGASPLHIAVRYKANLEVVRLLLDKGAEVDSTNLVSL